MFCVQCEQTQRRTTGNGCTGTQGACGKLAQTSDRQDLLIAALQNLSAWAVAARNENIILHEIDSFTPKALFATLTNVNFDSRRILALTQQAIKYREQLKACCKVQTQTMPEVILADEEAMQQQAHAWRPNRGEAAEDVIGLRLLCLYGLKGVAAYMEHAHVYGRYDNDLYLQFHQIMAWLGTQPEETSELLAAAMRIGKMNFAVMAMLEEAQTAVYGIPQPVAVNTKPVAGKAILISGHDLRDLQLLLEQTAGSGINIYTHGEMLPAHGYPQLKKHPHLAGNYGSGWQNQQKEFAAFPGPIVMTSNCIIDPFRGDYQQRIWTRSIVGWPGVAHLADDDFSAVIAQAQAMPGFIHSEIPHVINVGFGRQTLLDTTDALLDLVAQGQLRHVFLIGGCDGNRAQRSYFTELATAVPKDCLILTLGCGKYRFNKLDFGTLDALPRLLDVGQCNDSYAAIMLAVRLAEKLGCGVNDLPLSLVLSWFEQKAIAVLLTLLSLGVKNIYTGPTAPAFLSENLLTLLENEFGLRAISTPEKDLATLLRQPV
ncbi:hydroxylamine reductase [Kalamiella sp. sgz302252]|uniref:hydroxylamine reductase n=1 Tax=Pantoea sp. sgz302252 TaxID=3341827 RepID=UPI0036D32D97